MRKYTRIAIEVGELVDQKSEAYGNAYSKVREFLSLLWPDGITPDRYCDAVLMARIFDKQMRVATDRDAFGESPYIDMAGHSLLGAALHEERDGECGTASVAAEDEPREQHASQPKSVPPPTTTSAAATKPKNTSGGCFPPHANSSLNAALEAAFAQTATANASSEEEDLPLSPARKFEAAKKLWNGRNKDEHCAYCNEALWADRIAERVIVDGGLWYFDVHDHCLILFKQLLDDWRETVATGRKIR